MMVMPLGPYYAEALGISTAHLGLVAGSYTAAAARSPASSPRASSIASIGARRSGSRCSAWSRARRRARSRRVSAIAGGRACHRGRVRRPGHVDRAVDRRGRRSAGAARARDRRRDGGVLGRVGPGRADGPAPGDRGGWRLPVHRRRRDGRRRRHAGAAEDAVPAWPHRRRDGRRPRGPTLSALLGGRNDPARARDERARHADGVSRRAQHRAAPAAEPRLSRAIASTSATWSAAPPASSSCASRGTASTAMAPRACRSSGHVVLIGVLYFAFIAPGAIGTAGVLVRVRAVHGRHVDAQRQHELAVDAGAARRSARRLHVVAVDGATRLVGDGRVRLVAPACTRRRAGG